MFLTGGIANALCSAAYRDSLLFFSWISLSPSLRARACSDSARLIVASAGFMRFRDKQVQKFGSHDHTVRMGTDWPLMAIYRQMTKSQCVDQ